MYVLEYAQFHNRVFVTWIEAARFSTRAKAEACARAHGLTCEGEDHIVSYDPCEEEDVL